VQDAARVQVHEGLVAAIGERHRPTSDVAAAATFRFGRCELSEKRPGRTPGAGYAGVLSPHHQKLDRSRAQS
jgi:hypothetical protein